MDERLVFFHSVVRHKTHKHLGVTVINAAWLPSLGKSMCTFSKPVKSKDGQSMVIPRYGSYGWELPGIKEPVS